MNIRTCGLLFSGAVLCLQLNAQVQDDGFGNYRLLPSGTTPKTFTVGGAYWLAGSALNVRGDLMATPTGEVFKTVALAAAPTASWRLMQGGGTAIGFQRGHLFSQSGLGHFNIDATNGELRFLTSQLLRARILPTTTGVTINGFTGLDLSGFMGIGPFISALVPQPFSLFHIDDGGAQDTGYRDWMRAGTTITTQTDLCYFGIKNENTLLGGADHNQTVIGWADNTPGVHGSDVLKFIFLRDFGLAGAAGAANGLEAGRFYPVSTNEVNFGLGDYLTAGIAVQPTERLDVLNGRVRIRQLPTDPAANTLTKVLVVDDTPGAAFGVVKWRDVSTIGGGGSTCEWRMNALAPNDVWTAEGPANPGCPDSDENVGVGVIPSSTTGNDRGVKLDVLENTPNLDGYGNTGIQSNVLGRELGGNTGIHTSVSALYPYLTLNNTGISTWCFDATEENLGNWTKAEIRGGNNVNNTGLRSQALNSGGTISGLNLAVWGEAQSAAVNHAGKFEATGDGTENVGLWALAGAGSNNLGAALNYGLHASAGVGTTSVSNQNIAVFGSAVGNGATTLNYGAFGTAAGALENFGGYFEALDGSATLNVACKAHAYTFNPNWWAFWSEGNSYNSTGASWVPSDASLKTNVQGITNARLTLRQLRPSHYEYDQVGFGFMSLPQGLQYGLIADSVELVLPELVREITRPADRDSLGNVVNPAVTFKAMNYGAFTPLLIAAMQEQDLRIDSLQAIVATPLADAADVQAQLDAMQAQINLLQAQLAACCATGTGSLMQPGGNTGVTEVSAPGDTRLSIVPNPFAEEATIHFDVPEDGHVRLEVADGLGQVIQPLFDLMMDRGAQTWPLHPNLWPAGTYYVILHLPDGTVVKKAVKLGK